MTRPYRVSLPHRRLTYSTLTRAIRATLATDGAYVVEHRDAGVWVPLAVVWVRGGAVVERCDWHHLRTVAA